MRYRINRSQHLSQSPIKTITNTNFIEFDGKCGIKDTPKSKQLDNRGKTFNSMNKLHAIQS